MYNFFHTLDLTSSVVRYIKTENNDYLLTEKVNGEDCLNESYLRKPEKLCDVIAESLRFLHSQPYKNCPINNRTDTYIKAVSEGYSKGKYESNLFEGLWEFTSLNEAWGAAKEGMNNLESNVLIHILWGIWTLKYNLGTFRYTDRFIDCYGKNLINTDKLRCIAAMEMIGEG